MPRYPRIPGFEPVDAVEVVDYRPIFDRAPPVVGGYQLGQRLGTGTLGPCYEAWHLTRRAPAVVKLLTIDEAVHDRLLVERALLRSLQVLATLAHPGIVRLRDAGPTDNGIFIAVEPAQGRTLEAALATGWRPSTAQSLALASEWAEALARAHAAGLVHGNLHGGNVVLDEYQRSSITDFGLLHAARGRAEVDDQCQTSMQQACRAPESAAGADEQPAGDTHALGVLVYRLLLEEASFRQAAAWNHPVPHERRRWQPLAALRPDLPAEVCAWVDQALDPDPAARPELAAGLPQIRAATETVASPAPAPLAVRAPRKHRLQPARLALLALMAIVLAGAAGIVHKLRNPIAPNDGGHASAPALPTNESFESVAGTTPVSAVTRAPRGAAQTGLTRPALRLDR